MAHKSEPAVNRKHVPWRDVTCAILCVFTTGTVRAPYGHRTGTARAPYGHCVGTTRRAWSVCVPFIHHALMGVALSNEVQNIDRQFQYCVSSENRTLLAHSLVSTMPGQNLARAMPTPTSLCRNTYERMPHRRKLI